MEYFDESDAFKDGFEGDWQDPSYFGPYVEDYANRSI